MAKPRKLLTITAEGLSAIGIEPQAPDSAPGGATETPSDTTRPTAPTEAGEAPKARRTRTGSKQEQLIAMLREGATIDETVAATGWQSHTVRGAMAGALKKRLGLVITSERRKRGRVYRIAN